MDQTRLVHVGADILVHMCAGFYYNGKINELKGYIEDMALRVEQQDEVIRRLEEQISYVTRAFQQPFPVGDGSYAPHRDLPVSRPVPQPTPRPVPQPALQPVPPVQHVKLDLGSTFVSDTSPAGPPPVITEYDDQEDDVNVMAEEMSDGAMDRELQAELSELTGAN